MSDFLCNTVPFEPLPTIEPSIWSFTKVDFKIAAFASLPGWRVEPGWDSNPWPEADKY